MLYEVITEKAVVKSKDEIGQLAEAFNEMTADLIGQKLLAQEKQSQLQASISNLPLGFILVNQHNKLLMTNPAVEFIFDFEPQNWNLRNISNLLNNNPIV